MTELIKDELYWIQVSKEFDIEPGRYIGDTLNYGPKFEILGDELPAYQVKWIGDRIIVPTKSLKQCVGKRGRDDSKCWECKWYTNSPTEINVNPEICALIKPYWSQWEPK